MGKLPAVIGGDYSYSPLAIDDYSKMSGMSGGNCSMNNQTLSQQYFVVDTVFKISTLSTNLKIPVRLRRLMMMLKMLMVMWAVDMDLNGPSLSQSENSSILNNIDEDFDKGDVSSWYGSMNRCTYLQHNGLE